MGSCGRWAAVDAFAQIVDLIDGQRRVLREVLADGSFFIGDQVLLEVTQGSEDRCKLTVGEGYGR